MNDSKQTASSRHKGDTQTQTVSAYTKSAQVKSNKIPALNLKQTQSPASNQEIICSSYLLRNRKSVSCNIINYTPVSQHVHRSSCQHRTDSMFFCAFLFCFVTFCLIGFCWFSFLLFEKERVKTWHLAEWTVGKDLGGVRGGERIRSKYMKKS